MFTSSAAFEQELFRVLELLRTGERKNPLLRADLDDDDFSDVIDYAVANKFTVALEPDWVDGSFLPRTIKARLSYYGLKALEVHQAQQAGRKSLL